MNECMWKLEKWLTLLTAALTRRFLNDFTLNTKPKCGFTSGYT